MCGEHRSVIVAGNERQTDVLKTVVENASQSAARRPTRAKTYRSTHSTIAPKSQAKSSALHLHFDDDSTIS
jgi:hypothetical protein